MPDIKSNKKDGTYISENDRVLAWTKDVAESTAKEAPPPMSQARRSEARHVEREPPRVTVNQVITTPAVVVTRTRPESNPTDEISTKAIIGTVLGATAGAVVAYRTYVPSLYSLFGIVQISSFETRPKKSLSFVTYLRPHEIPSIGHTDCKYVVQP